jgi:hypothetical protein
LILAGLLAAAAVHHAASARQDPPPPPSGIVVHLFGQNSIMSNVMPSVTRTGAGIGGAPAGAAAASGDAGAQAASAAPGYAEPSMGDVLHQMFVTGDPNSPPQPSTGRTKQRLSD